MTWLIERGRATASDVMWNLMAFWLMRGHLAEGLEWYERSLRLPSLPPYASGRSASIDALMKDIDSTL